MWSGSRSPSGFESFFGRSSLSVRCLFDMVVTGMGKTSNTLSVATGLQLDLYKPSSTWEHLSQPRCRGFHGTRLGRQICSSTVCARGRVGKAAAVPTLHSYVRTERGKECVRSGRIVNQSERSDRCGLTSLHGYRRIYGMKPSGIAAANDVHAGQGSAGELAVAWVTELFES